jgi:hypothetical protein
MWYTILIMLVVDLGGLLLVYVLLRDRVRRATTANAQIAEIRDEMSRLVVDLNQTTDRNIALIEDRIASLNELLSAADKKIGLLSREIEKHDLGTRMYSRLAGGQPSRAAGAAAPRVAEPVGAPIMVPAEPSRTRGAAERAVPAVEIAADGKPPLSVELSEKPDLHQRVMMLQRAGFAPPLIASRVGAPLGEVELIISLERRKGQA